MQRYFLWVLLPAILVLAGGRHSNSAERPNIVVFLADDLGIGDLGVTGQLARAAAGLPAIHTPNIDQLAGQSLQFQNMYAGAPFCSASRATLLTGFDHAHVTKEWADGYHGLRKGELDKTWGQVLQDAGYATNMVGKWHVGGVHGPSHTTNFNPDAIPTQKGFDSVLGGMLSGYRPPNLWESDGQGGLRLTPNAPDPTFPGPGGKFRYEQDVVTEYVVDFIGQHANAAEPFASYVAFKTPHTDFHMVEMDPLYANETWSETHKQYASMITRMDDHVGQILAALDDPNGDGDQSDSVADNTLVIFASDNGPLWTPHANGFDTEFFDSNSFYSGQKSNTLEAGMRTPFFVRWGDVVQPGINTTHVGTFADILPTFAEIVGEETPNGVDGASMLNTFTGGEAHRPDVYVWHAISLHTKLDQPGWAIRVGDWKLIWRVNSGTHQLYDLESDPSELSNLAASRTDILAALQEIAGREGLTAEPYYQTRGATERNLYFTQYKSWDPQGDSTNFSAAENWAGGTQYLRAEHELNGTEAFGWNTGPADNWLATVANASAVEQRIQVTADASVLAMEIRGDTGKMAVDVAAGMTLTARNGVRIGAGGELNLQGANLQTVRDIDIRAGGVLRGSGAITGDQDVLGGIAEFQGQGLLEPRILNAGVVDIGGNSSAARLLVFGDFEQFETGVLEIDLLGGSGEAGVDFDQLQVAGSAKIDGGLSLSFGEGFTPQLGHEFEVLAADHISGAFNSISAPSLVSGLYWSLFRDDTSILLSIIDELDADFDFDLDVDGADLLTLQRNFGRTDALRMDGDATGDGIVNAADWAVLDSQLGLVVLPSMPTEIGAVPEPAAWTLAILGTTLAALRRKKRALRSPQA